MDMAWTALLFFWGVLTPQKFLVEWLLTLAPTD